MTATPKELLDRCLEIEGLLALIIQRDNDVPTELYDLISQRTESLLSRLRELKSEETKPAPLADSSLPHTECEESRMADAAIADATLTEEAADADEPIKNTPERTDDSDTVASQDPSDGFDKNDQPENMESTENMDSVHHRSDSEPSVSSQKKVKFHFSVNDRFRFRRELFNFNDEEMDEALDVAAQMSTIEELEAYLYDDLCLDPSDETVQDFITIISQHLK